MAPRRRKASSTTYLRQLLRRARRLLSKNERKAYPLLLECVARLETLVKRLHQHKKRIVIFLPLSIFELFAAGLSD
jgi:hypothetical protein